MRSLAIYPASEIAGMTTPEGKVTADCQFCGAHYEFEPSELGSEAEGRRVSRAGRPAAVEGRVEPGDGKWPSARLRHEPGRGGRQGQASQIASASQGPKAIRRAAAPVASA